jgi:hypothetical protein
MPFDNIFDLVVAFMVVVIIAKAVCGVIRHLLRTPFQKEMDEAAEEYRQMSMEVDALREELQEYFND